MSKLKILSLGITACFFVSSCITLLILFLLSYFSTIDFGSTGFIILNFIGSLTVLLNSFIFNEKTKKILTLIITLAICLILFTIFSELGKTYFIVIFSILIIILLLFRSNSIYFLIFYFPYFLLYSFLYGMNNFIKIELLLIGGIFQLFYALFFYLYFTKYRFIDN